MVHRSDGRPQLIRDIFSIVLWIVCLAAVVLFIILVFSLVLRSWA